MGASSSIAINGAWGSGKTFFVKQCKMVIDACNPFGSVPEITCEDGETLGDEHTRKLIKGKIGDLENIEITKSS